MRGCRFLVLLCLALGAVSAAARQAQDPVPAMRLAQATQAVGPDRAAAIVRRALGGRVLSVKTVGDSGARRYRVKILLPGGRVRVVNVDAARGRIVD